MDPYVDFINWCLAKLALDPENIMASASICHVIPRISRPLLDNISFDDGEAGYILEALRYVYSTQTIIDEYGDYLNSNIVYRDRLVSRLNDASINNLENNM